MGGPDTALLLFWPGKAQGSRAGGWAGHGMKSRLPAKDSRHDVYLLNLLLKAAGAALLVGSREQPKAVNRA